MPLTELQKRAMIRRALLYKANDLRMLASDKDKDHNADLRVEADKYCLLAEEYK